MIHKSPITFINIAVNLSGGLLGMKEGQVGVPLPDNCVRAIFIRRIKRFLVELEKDGKTIWAHTNNTGAMRGVPGSGATALLSRAANPARKLPYTLERIEKNIDGTGASFWIGVNTSLPNKLVEAAFYGGQLPFMAGFTKFTREARRGKSRLDACLENESGQRLWLECKNVSLVENGRAIFPDAPSERARKHLHELMDIVRHGERGAMFYAVQRPDATAFAPAEFIDPEYAELFYQARKQGVEAYAYELIQAPKATMLGRRLKEQV